MPKELRDEKFNEMLWKFNQIEHVDAELNVKLQIAFNEGIIAADEYILAKIAPRLAALEALANVWN